MSKDSHRPTLGQQMTHSQLPWDVLGICLGRLGQSIQQAAQMPLGRRSQQGKSIRKIELGCHCVCVCKGGCLGLGLGGRGLHKKGFSSSQFHFANQKANSKSNLRAVTASVPRPCVCPSVPLSISGANGTSCALETIQRPPMANSAGSSAFSNGMAHNDPPVFQLGFFVISQLDTVFSFSLYLSFVWASCQVESDKPLTVSRHSTLRNCDCKDAATCAPHCRRVACIFHLDGRESQEVRLSLLYVAFTLHMLNLSWPSSSHKTAQQFDTLQLVCAPHELQL